MSRRVKLVIILAIIAVLGILFALGLRGSRKGTGVKPVEEVGSTTAQSAAIQTAEAPALTAAQRSELALELSLQTLARSFAERYGSYSNQNRFENIKELYPFMTAALRASSTLEIAKAQSNAPTPKEYVGVTTQAVSVEVAGKTDTSAKVKVQTRRKETRVSEAAPRIDQQVLILDFVKEGKQWKVDKAAWTD